jgi:hypothetical protein
MKKIISFCLLASLAFTACRKDTLSPVSESTHSTVDDFQSPVSGGSNARRGIADDHLKIAIRKIENKENMYRLVIKMDSIEITEKGETKLVPLPKDATVTAGLSIPDDKDPKASKVIFEKNELNFKKQNEKGFTVFVSDPFTTDVNFDYELVSLETSVRLVSHFGDLQIVHSQEFFMIVPPGKAINQSPEVVKTKTQGKWTHSSGVEFAKSVIITVANDPAQKINTLYYVPDLIKIPGNGVGNSSSILSLKLLEFKKLDFDKNTGVARFINSDIEAIYSKDLVPKDWAGLGSLYTKMEILTVKPGEKPIEESDPDANSPDGLAVRDTGKITWAMVDYGDGGDVILYRNGGGTVTFNDPIAKNQYTPLKGNSTR